MAKVTTDRIDGVDIDIHVDGAGQFYAEFNDERFVADTRLKLLDLLTKAVKKVRNLKPIDVTLVNLVPNTNKGGWDNDKFTTGRGVVHAVLRGKHSQHYNTYLFATADGKTKFKVSSRPKDHVCRRLSAAEVSTYTKLTAAVDEAEAALKAWLDERRLDPDDALRVK